MSSADLFLYSPDAAESDVTNEASDGDMSDDDRASPASQRHKFTEIKEQMYQVSEPVLKRPIYTK
jgi:hypothetical protein